MKIVKVEPKWKETVIKNGQEGCIFYITDREYIMANLNPKSEGNLFEKGYTVEYDDGYSNWFPKDVYENSKSMK